MKEKLFLVILTICIAFACTKSSKTGDPTEDLQWLKAKKVEASQNCTCIPSIWQATYQGETIYEIGCSGPACNCAHSFYDKAGKAVSGSEEVSRPAFLEKIKNRELIWSCK